MENQILNRKYTKYHSLWFWWIALTIVYLVGSFLIMWGWSIIWTETTISNFYGIIGIFVPFGFWSYFGMFFGSGVKLLLLPIFLISFYFLEGWLKKLYLSGKISLALKLTIGLIFLILSTAAADIILWGCWQSAVFTGLVADCTSFVE